MSVAKRLGEYFRTIGTSVHQVTKRCDFTRGALDKVLRKDTGLHSDTLAKILSEYPDLDADWLLLGIGEMKRSAPRPTGSKEPIVPRAHVSRASAAKSLTDQEIDAVRKLLQDQVEAAQKGATPAKGRKAG